MTFAGRRYRRSPARLLSLVLTAHLMIVAASARAQDAASAAQANNPLANMTAFNVQDYYIGDLTGSDESANQFWLRYATPISVAETNWILRASLPVNTFPTGPGGDKDTGIGDFNVFAAYLMDTGNPAVSFGIGPQLTAPTASEDELGSEKWSAGLANVLFNACSRSRSTSSAAAPICQPDWQVFLGFNMQFVN